MDNTALFKIGYGLYVLTAHEDRRDNGCITNTVLQVTSSPPLTGVITVNKQNYTHDMINKSRKFNISILTTEAPFEVFKHFGFQTGRTVDKFADFKNFKRAKNGIIYLPEHTNAYLSFDVLYTFDFGTHTMFKAEIVDGEALSNVESVTYSYYQQHIKPKPQTAPKSGHRCKICNFVYEGDVLPGDFICPICKHGVNDFEKIAI